uniref:C-type lectin domain-containing protein n=1 Tax=Gasterosteus aculeatus aculeatus TaxID=481459 RepID=G3Q8R7_GASAC
MDYWLIIFVLTGALVYVVSAQTRLYTFVSTPLNWREAQSVCRQNYTDLATAESTADISAIIGTTSTYTGTLNDTASFVKVDTLSNWTEAQRFCRENYVDLASVRNQQENDIINFLSDGFFWIGLHREKQWSDGSTSLFRIWKIGQPSFIGEGCVSTAFNDSGRWSEQDCSLSLPFICYTTNTPPNTDTFKSIGQNETSITLQWNQVNTNVSFVLKFNGTERNISEPVNGPVIYTVSSLTAGTKYTFTLFS